MADETNSAYHRAFLVIEDAEEYLPGGSAIREESGDPIGYPQTLVTAGCPMASLAHRSMGARHR